ncbi:hypothetical protein BDW22DRAFT_1357059 [Trametopsis cervina]|nr:hypothetical protein BDW22DRAFT_1357059 [Trametopsis cervina]
MTREVSTLLSSSEPRTSVPAKVSIGHIQLRDLLLCPHEHGTVIYPQYQSILEHDLAHPHSTPRSILDLSYTPNSLSTLVNPDTGDTLLAAGGQEAELVLALYAPASAQPRGDSQSQHFGRHRWKYFERLEGASINNSVLLTSLSLTGSNESSVEPRVVISNNDRSVKFYDVAVRSTRHGSEGGSKRLQPAGQLNLGVPVNHSSISPDGRTLLSVGDSPDVFLHRITGGAHVKFSQMMKLSLSPYITAFPSYSYGSPSQFHGPTPVPASFSSSFSANGSKFAVASQEGVVVVWDVRSTKPLKVIQTDKSRGGAAASNSWPSGMAGGYLYEDWIRFPNKAPGWGVRSVKFSPRGAGREVLTFTEHTSLMHVMDARTFETEEIVRIPNTETPPTSRSGTARPRSISPLPRPASTNAPADAPLRTPPRIMLFSGALADTFRIPSSDSTGSDRRRLPGRRLQNREWSADEDGEGIVFIPPLGDREVDDDVRRLFQGRNALRAGRPEPTMLDDPDEPSRENEDRVEDDMDVDELESDCVSSYNPSRASSPSPPSNARAQSSSQVPTPTQLSSSVGRVEGPRRTSLLERRESSGPYISRRGSSQGLRRNRRAPESPESSDVEADIDIAGTCFDPSGEFIYAASSKGVFEWRVRGAEQKWWNDFTWA